MYQYLFVILCATAWLQYNQACFPEFLQTNNTQRDWRGMVRAQFTEFTTSVSVQGNTMESIATDSSTTSFSWVCLQTLARGRLLVAHEESGQQSTQYRCIEVVKRSENVVQVKKSVKSRSMNRALCNSLELDPWLLVEKTHVAEDEHVCSLTGGFSVRIYDKMYQQGVCDGYSGETRIESECLAGEGLFFYYRQQSCVPEGLYMYFTQRTVCLANWVEGPHTFMLLRHDKRKEFIWLMRYPTTSGDSFMAYLMKDLVADVDTPVTVSTNYLRLDMVRDPPRPVSSLCVDDYEVCSWWKEPCATGNQKIALTCTRTCELCNATRPSVCRFPQEWQGTWYDSSHIESPAVTAETTQLTIHGKVQEKFYCLDWDKSPSPDPNDRNTIDQMLVTDFDNGCRPRYSCARATQQSDSVMFFKLSQTLRWPFTGSITEPVDCSHFTYDHEQMYLDNKYRNKNPRLLYGKEASEEVECSIPDNLRNYIADFERGGECPGTIVAETSNKKAIQVVLEDCEWNLPATVFSCRQSLRLTPSRDQLVITEAAKANQRELYCWYFPKRPKTTFYLLEGNKCNDALRKRVNRDRLDPLVTFSKHRRKASTAVNPDNTSPNVDSTEPLQSDDSKQPSDVNRRTKPPPEPENKTVVEGGEVTGEESGDAASKVGPYVVIAAVLIFALFQIPCLCKGSS